MLLSTNRSSDPGAVVVSHFYAVPGWRAEQPVVRAADLAASPVYLYRFPRCLGGAQSVSADPRREP